MWRNTSGGWGLPSILLHWLSAVAVVGLFALGWWMTGLGYYDDWYYLAPWWHRSVGMILFGATILRLVWRACQPTPHSQGHRLERIAAHLGHIALYVLMLVVLVSGYLISTADGSGIQVFGWFEVPAVISGLRNQATLAGIVHWYASLILMALAIGHMLAALKHHFIDRNDTLIRMLSPTSSRRKMD
ncbi:cytochrome b [Aidingimonas halophila]|uniref:Cytochrome b561 n=1 Tax=Aidingimonas halophila TaxID=574349 RepID=A0A1H3DEE5_9GAMM|nr:cytochrome b [Aidingimonas halophila]GHC30041.1 cytochrome b [Aidingimonas halophila]SDX64690.1 Cytochrome b561 [Aidingimonas halophila]